MEPMDLMDAGGVEVLLPHGLFDEDGVCHRRVVLRPITGFQEAMLGRKNPVKASVLLASCLARLGDYEEVGPSLVLALTRGDRHHLALHLRATLFGDTIEITLRCPNPACKELADMELSVSSIAPVKREQAPELLTIETPDGVAQVREPTGVDDEFVALSSADRRSRSALLWSRLVVDFAGRGQLTPEEWFALSAPARHAIALGLATQSTAPDLSFLSACPTCGAILELELDPSALLAKELASNDERLFAEVHCLAWYYHWSERDILALPRARRWRYIELLRRQIENRPIVDGWSKV